jgi:hypothetical protein
MNIEITKKTEVNAKTVKISMKVCDGFSYELLDDQGKVIHDQDSGYVPSFMPGQHYGDYLMLDIDVDSGTITNWKKNVPTLYEDAVNGG